MTKIKKVAPKIGFIPSAVMRDEYIDFTKTRPAVKAAAARVKKALGHLGRVVSAGVLEAPADADRIRVELAHAGVDVLVYVAFAYQKGATAMRVFERTNLPIIIWNTQDLPRLPDDADFDQMWTNSGLAGLGDVCNALTRAGRKFEVVTSRRDDPAGLKRAAEIAVAAAVKRKLREARLAAVGRIYEGMTDFRVDEFRFHDELGPVIVPVDQNLIAKQMEKVTPRRVADKLKRDRARWNTAAISDEVLAHSVRTALAMEEVVVKQYKADALAQLDQSWSFDKRIGCVPSYGYLHLNDLGVPCTCERDVLTAAALLVGQYVSGGLSALVEFFDMNFDEGSVVLCHDSNGTPALAEDSKDVTLNEVPISLCPGDWGPGVGADLAYPPGEVTMLSLAASRDGWKMIAAGGEALRKPSRAIGAPYMVWKPAAAPLPEWCNRWLKAGCTHHMAVWYGNHLAELKTLAGLLGIEYEEV